MTAFNLLEWYNEKVGDTTADIKTISLSTGALQVTDSLRGEAVLMTEHENTETAFGRPEIRVNVENPNAEHQTAFAVVTPEVPSSHLINAIRNALELYRLKNQSQSELKNQQRRDYMFKELLEIGKSLNSFHNIDDLLWNVLHKSRHIMGADAGSVYVVENIDPMGEQQQLRFKLTQNDSMEVESSEFVMPVSAKSIAGTATVMKRTIDIPDVHIIPADAPYSFDASFDEKTGYRTISVLAVPMINQKGTVMGVIQLINKKRTPEKKLVSSGDFDQEVIPMDTESKDMVETLASQAGVALENVRLYQEIEDIFKGLVKASVHAIEQRDPTTSGHSFRVAALTRELAIAVNADTSPRFKDVHFSEADIKEIETAAVLHDFGKVGVREEVLVKAKKLYPENLENIRTRLNFIRTSIENDHLQRRMLMIEEGTPSEELTILDEAKKRSVDDIDECWRIINTANEPTVLEEGDFNKVREIAERTFFDINGERKAYLTPEEVTALQVAKGSLTKEELDEIRSHVSHTKSFLEKIPWGQSMRNIPQYAGCHHEKLDGSGYPCGMKSNEIPLASKIMAVADIFDALTAADRPYKKAVPLDKALTILDYEVRDNHIDGDLVHLFKEQRIYKITEDGNLPDLLH